MFQKIKNLLKRIKNFLKLKRAEKGFISLSFILGVAIIALATYLTATAVLESPSFRNFLGDVGIGIARGLGYLLYIFSDLFIRITTEIFKAVITPKFMAFSITKDNQIVEGGARLVRDFANMLIVLGFVAVAIATTLRIREYGAQKLLPLLIAVAILVNFSSVICGLFIDVANITMNYFLGKGAGGIAYQYESIMGSEKIQEKMEEYTKSKEGSTAGYLGLLWGITFFNFIAGGVFLYLSIMLIARQVMLMALVILAPLAFVFCVFGFTKKYFKMWWEHFLGWTFFGVIAIFFIYLATWTIAAGIFGSSEIPKAGEEVEKMGAGFLGFFVPLVFLILGYKISRATAGFGADSVIGFATKAGGIALGAGAALAGATATRLGSAMKETGAGQAVGGAWGRTMEWAHLQRKGITAQQKQERGQEALKRVKAQYAEKGGQKKMDKALEGKGVMLPQDRAAWAALAAEEGKIKDDRHVAQLAKAESYGFKRSDWEKKDPNLAAHNSRTVSNLMSTGKFKNSEEAQAEAVKQSVRKMSPSEFRRNVTSPNAYTPAVFSSMTGAQINDVYRHGSQTQKDALGQMVTTKRKGTSEYSKMLKKEGKREERADLAKNIRNVRAQLMPPTSPR